MNKIKIKVQTKQILADIITPVGIYLKIRDLFPKSLLLEGADYRGSKNSYSFICISPIASFITNNRKIQIQLPNSEKSEIAIKDINTVSKELLQFIKIFQIDENSNEAEVNGIFGYTSYDAIQYFEDIRFQEIKNLKEKIPEMAYGFYKYIIAINHFKNTLSIIENILENEESKIDEIQSVLQSRNYAMFNFKPEGEEKSNLSDKDYMYMVTKGKEHCYRGDVFQIVLSRQFSQKFSGDDFNVYRALRSINPSPYLFYFDYGNYKIFGSSPEPQIEIKENTASINPIAGTFRRTGDDLKDKELAEQLSKDPKENAEHVMLVDLARNDLSRNAKNVHVEYYKEIHYYSHVLHMVSKVTGILPQGTNTIKVMGESFPAGTLSGAPKYKAMQLIDRYENKNRGYYGGCIGYIGLNGDINHAILIRSFLSKDNTLYYQAGAGIVADSKEESELKEVNNKLAALKKAVIMAKEL
ncbi:MAG: anthranilate synthase component I family protein [Bacteroidales bacterium]|nr:anthranilate synthase component I family protein [Bacteroidales bacterium]